jgi:hypothetical protein
VLPTRQYGTSAIKSAHPHLGGPRFSLDAASHCRVAFEALLFTLAAALHIFGSGWRVMFFVPVIEQAVVAHFSSSSSVFC